MSDKKPTDKTTRALDGLWKAGRNGMVSIAWPPGHAPTCASGDLPDLAELRQATISRFAWRRYLTRRLKAELIDEGFWEENLDRYAKDLILVHIDQGYDEIKADALLQEATRHRCLAAKTPFSLPDGTTLLTYWASKETWSPSEAAHLVCGLIPEAADILDGYLNRSPRTITGLCGNVFAEPHGRPVVEILKQWEERWTSKAERPDRERPSDFIAWCKRRGIDAGWLEAVANETVQSGLVSTAGGTSNAAGQHVRREKASTVQDNNILAALRARGIDPLKMPKPPLGNKPWPLREELAKELRYTKSMMVKAFTRLRDDGRMKHE